MDDTITISRGDCLVMQLEWWDDNGDPLPIAGGTITVTDASPAVLEETVFEITGTNTAKGELPANRAALLGLGRVNFLRVRLELPGTCPIVTPPFAVEVE